MPLEPQLLQQYLSLAHNFIILFKIFLFLSSAPLVVQINHHLLHSNRQWRHYVDQKRDQKRKNPMVAANENPHAYGGGGLVSFYILYFIFFLN